MMVLQIAIYGTLFLLEVIGLLAFSYWGFQLNKELLWKIIFGLGTPLLVAVFWGAFVAPQATYPVSIPVRTTLQLTVFGLAALALLASDKKRFSLLFIIVVIITLAVIQVMEHR